MARPDPDQWLALCVEAQSAVDRLHRDGKTVLARAKRGLKDGYPENSLPVSGGKGGIARPVEATVLAREAFDPIRRSAATMIGELRRALQALRSADGARAVVMGEGEALADVIPLRSSKGNCEACGRYMDGSMDTKRLKDGLCPPHWMRWLRYGRPERDGFHELIKAELAAKEAV